MTDLAALQKLQEEAESCRACVLHLNRTKLVFGSGDPNTKIVLVGEAPGEQEDLSGEPFVGWAGQLLNRMLRDVGLSREEVYIANVLKCRPPGNRDPKTREVQACWALLQRQLRILQPRAIVTLGRFSAQRLTLHYGPLSAIREIDGLVCTLGSLEIPVFPIWHPSYVGRQMRMASGNPEWKHQAKVAYQDCITGLQAALSLTA